MFFKREREFQYHPGIEQIISDVIGGGTISRSDLAVFFSGEQLKELPPLCLVGQADDGVWHVVKTAEMYADAAAEAIKYQVEKNHLFAVGDVITKSGLAGIAAAITAIDKSEDNYDAITVGATLGDLSDGDVLVLASAAADAGSASYLYTPTVLTMNKVDLTVANQSSGLLEAGKVNASVIPFPIDSTLKSALSGIRFV